MARLSDGAFKLPKVAAQFHAVAIKPTAAGASALVGCGLLVAAPSNLPRMLSDRLGVKRHLRMGVLRRRRRAMPAGSEPSQLDTDLTDVLIK